MDINLCEDCGNPLFNDDRELCCICTLIAYKHIPDSDILPDKDRPLWDELYFNKMNQNQGDCDAIS